MTQIKASILAALWCSQIDRETGEPGLGIETKTSLEWGSLLYGITPELEQSGSDEAATLGSRFSVLGGGVQLVEFWLQVCRCLSQCDKTGKDLVPQLLWWEEGVVPPKLLSKGRSHPPRPTPKIRVLIRKREEMLGGQRPTIVYFIWSTVNHLTQTKLNDRFSLKEGVQLSAAKWLGVYSEPLLYGNSGRGEIWVWAKRISETPTSLSAQLGCADLTVTVKTKWARTWSVYTVTK